MTRCVGAMKGAVVLWTWLLDITTAHGTPKRAVLAGLTLLSAACLQVAAVRSAVQLREQVRLACAVGLVQSAISSFAAHFPATCLPVNGRFTWFMSRDLLLLPSCPAPGLWQLSRPFAHHSGPQRQDEVWQVRLQHLRSCLANAIATPDTPNSCCSTPCFASALCRFWFR